MSVRGERVVYRERVEEDAPRRTYTTVKRYQVPESTRSVYKGEEDEVKEDKIIIRRERREDPPPQRDDIEYRVTERKREPAREEVDYRFSERVTEREREPRRDISYRVIERDNDYDRNSGSGGRSEYRMYERDREVVRAPSPPPEHERVREYRFERERDFSPPRRTTITRDREDFDIEKFTRSTEYYQQPQPIIIRESAPAPQPIIIREERRDPAPIIIREERREPHYEFIEREEVRDESRSLVKKEEPPTPTVAAATTVVAASARSPSEKAPPQPQEEDYFYERRIREVDRSRRRDESHDRKSEIRPRDSASQYSSDDSYEYVRRERTTYDDRDRSRSRSRSPHHKLHLAEGAAAGIGAAEIIRRHRKSQGQGGGHRGRDLIGGAALGAVGAEALSRVRSKSRRRKSRSRSSSYESRRDKRDKRKHRSRSRSRSKSVTRVQQLGGLAAVAAVGALAGYALKNKGKNKETIIVPDARPRRSRSRRRRASVDSYDTYGSPALNVRGTPQDPEHRNRTMAKAGLATAAAAGIWDRYRSKSRGARSRSRVRQGVPIAAAGLGGAALAGLYEKNKANQQAKKEAIIADEVGRGRRRRSRSRSRSVPAPYPVDDGRSFDDRPMIAYGDEPIYSEPQRGYYSDEEPGMYRRRHGGSSSGSSPDNRRRRSRSRGRNLAEAGAAAGVAAVAAHEIGKRRERSRQRDESRRRRDEDARYNDQYGHDNAYPSPPVGDNSGYIQPPQGGGYANDQTYPSSNYFPPPPTGEEYAREGAANGGEHAYAAYNPADYAQGNNQHHQQQQSYNPTYGGYGESDPNLGAPYPGDTYAGDPRFPGAAHDGRTGRDPENVSGPNDASAASAAVPRDSHDADGIESPRPDRSRSQSRVRFDLDSNTLHTLNSPEGSSRQAHEERHSDGEQDQDKKHRRRRRRHHDDETERHRNSTGLMHDKYDHSPDGNDSDGTVDLPPRFDERGNRKEGDPLTDKINDLLGGAGLGDILGRVLGGESEDDGGRSGRRRHRR